MLVALDLRAEQTVHDAPVLVKLDDGPRRPQQQLVVIEVVRLAANHGASAMHGRLVERGIAWKLIADTVLLGFLLRAEIIQGMAL